MSSPLAGALMMTFLAPAAICARLLRLGEQAGRLDHDVCADAAPRNRARVALGEDLQPVAVDDQITAVDGHGAVEATVVGVVAEEMRVGGRVDEVVDRHDVELVAVALEHRLEHLPADAAESVDADLYLCHVNQFLLKCECYTKAELRMCVRSD